MPKTKKKRCENCNKKLGIIVYNCKCNMKKLCAKCKYPENHNCTFDFVKEAQEKLKKNNPAIKFDKLVKLK